MSSLSKERIHYLLDVYISKQATAAEESELMDWVLEAGEDSELRSYVLDTWNQYKPTEDLSYVNWDEIYSRIMQPPVVSTEPKVRKMRWFRLTAAAVVLVALTAGAYLYFNHNTQQPIAATQPKQNDIAPPSGNKAVLTLADGTKIELDSSGNGTIALQGNVRIIKQSNGEIKYTGSNTQEVSYNTLNVPRGSRPLSLVLSDGSKVWLNVGSSLTYPTAFTGNERKVKITGEAYFEVVHNEKMPFVVQNGDLTVRDLGTHFNVNTYEDEAAERITLLEGSVRITKNTLSELLKPGQQARINNNVNSIKVLNDVDLDEVMAWKDGKFMFDKNTDIGAIMRQISRWYNVSIEYEGNINQRFWGSISKNVNVSQVLKILEATGGVKFSVEGNKIIVMPASP
ncbi:MAG TPA: FecR domain-containing protein [Hanamia sp.]|nr:FecR domain-containing protein [Hanamia sp.]